MSSTSKIKDHSDDGISFRFTTDCDHYGTVRPVRATGGAKEGQWSCKILGPKVKLSSGVKTVYCEPRIIAAQYAIARYLRVQASSVHMVRSERDTSVYNSPTKTMSSFPAVESMPPAALVSPTWLVKSEVPTLHRCDYDSLMAKATPHGKDIWEASPNRLATCKGCREKIQKGQQRIGKWTHNEHFHRWYHVYYHAECASDELKAGLHLKDTRNEDAKRQALLQTRKDLRKSLRMLRFSFSQRLHVEPYMIFNDVTLDDIIVKLPTTKSELVNCNGIKEKKFRSFGSAILEVTKAYSRKENRTGNGPRNINAMLSSSSNLKRDESDNDDVEVLGTLNCEEIVERAVKLAAANGQIIEL